MGGVRKEGILLVDDQGEAGVAVEISGPLGANTVTDSVSVTIATDQPPIPVTGDISVTVTDVDQGDPNTVANGWPVKITDGTDTSDVVAGNTVPLYANPALTVVNRESVKNGSDTTVAAFERGPLAFGKGSFDNTARALPIITTNDLTSGQTVPNTNRLAVSSLESAYGGQGTALTVLGSLNAIAETFGYDVNGCGAFVSIVDTGLNFIGTIKPYISSRAVGSSIQHCLAVDVGTGKFVDTLSVGRYYYIPASRNYTTGIKVTAYTSGSCSASVTPTSFPIATFTSSTIANTTGSGAVNIQDGSNSITVDGPLTDVELRTSPVGVSITDGTSTANVSGGFQKGLLVAGTSLQGDTVVDDQVLIVGGANPGGGAHRLEMNASSELLVDGSNNVQPVSGPLTDAELRASEVIVTGTVEAAISTQPGGWVASATSTPVGTDRGLVVRNIPSGTQTVSGAVTVSATDLDIRNLLFANDKVDVSGSSITMIDSPVDVSGSTDVEVKISKSATATQTQVPDNAASVTILASNASRKGATIVNTSTATLYLRFSSSAATTSNYTVALVAGAYYEVPFQYTGQITGIWATDPNTGNANVTEFTT